MSARQGDAVSGLLESTKLPWNRAWRDGPVATEPDGRLPAAELWHGMRITLLSPRPIELGRLGAQWMKDRASRRPAGAGSVEELEEPLVEPARPGERGIGRRGAKGAGPIDVEALANARFVGDRTVANSASIAFLAEFQDRALLVGGDARAEVLAESIRALLAQRRLERLRVDAFVIPHGGSARNMSRELLEVLECERYLVSTSGEAFNHPDRETIARILTYGRARPDSALTLVFNYRAKSTEIWADPALQARYRYKAIYPERGAGIKLGIL